MQSPVRSVLLLAMALTVVLIVILAFIVLLEPNQRRIVKVRRYRRRPEVLASETICETQSTSEPEAIASEAEVEVVAESAEMVDSAGPEKSKVMNERAPAGLSTARVGRAVITWAIILLTLGAMFSAYFITSTNAYCAKTCHVNQVSVLEADGLMHANCVACHERPGLSAVPQNIVRRAAMVVAQLMGRSPQGAIVDSLSCANCHQKVIHFETFSADGIKMSHAEPYVAGATCTSCHAKTGHSKTRAYSMSSCVICHNNTKASADCLTCHATQPLARVSNESTTSLGSGKVTYPLVDVKPQCGGCHDQVKQCDSCHGLRMPHEDRFVQGGHAPIAVFDGKKLCWKCHQTTDCGRCHGPFTAHQSNWRQAHQKFPWDSPCACHAQKGGTPVCYQCHSPVAPHRLLR